MFSDKQFLVGLLLGAVMTLILEGIRYAMRVCRGPHEIQESCPAQPIYDFFEEATVGYLQIDLDGIVSRVNPKTSELFGLCRSEILGKHFSELDLFNPQERCPEGFRRKLSGGLPLHPYRRILQRRDGSVITIEVQEVLLRDKQGNVVGLLQVTTDITDCQRMEERALEAASELNALFQAFPDLFLKVNVNGTVLDCKRGDPKDPFLCPENFLGRSLHDVLPADAARLITETAAAARNTGSLKFSEYSLRSGESLAFYECRVLPLFWDQAAAIIRNVNKDKEAEKKLGHYAEELERKNDQLEATLTAAREATKLRSQFLANVRNEIRTPMNGVMSMLDALYGTELSAEQTRYIEHLKQSANSLLGFINDILDASRIDTGKLRLERIPFHLKVMLQELASVFEIRARAKGLSFSCLLPTVFPAIAVGDPGRLRQVLSNLLANAVKGFEVGEVRLELELMGKTDRTITVRFTVSNPGSADAPDVSQTLRAQRRSSAITTDGDELGLAISKQIVEKLGGKLDVKREMGRRSTFSFTAMFETQTPESRVLKPGPDSLEGVRVLIAGSNVDLLNQLLESWGCETAAVSASSAIAPAVQDATAEGKPFRLAVVDIDLPHLSKDILAEAIPPHSTKDLLLIAMTSSPLRGDGIELREEGYSAYLQKPIQASTLHDILAEVLRPRGVIEGAETFALVTRHTLSEQRLGR